MSLSFVNITNESGIILNWISGLIRLYPWIMRVSLVLHRIVQ
ncbi:MAG TPA: hypothetical protein VFZ23_15890 [Pyrinomonadaceae bacterium]